MTLEMISCPNCGNDFPKKRKELGYTVCVSCSTVKPVVGITTVEGTGDHTWNDLIIMDQDTAFAIAQKEAELTGRKVDIEYLDFDSQDNTPSFNQAVKTMIEEEEGVVPKVKKEENIYNSDDIDDEEGEEDDLIEDLDTASLIDLEDLEDLD